MANEKSSSQPIAESVLATLAAAADAARQAYMTALQANPGADLSQIYAKEMAAARAWSDAEVKALGNDSAVVAAQKDLASATQVIRNELSTIKNISSWLTLLDNLVKLATTVSSFFV